MVAVEAMIFGRTPSREQIEGHLVDPCNGTEGTGNQVQLVLDDEIDGPRSGCLSEQGNGVLVTRYLGELVDRGDDQ